jgi:hypothetical protein
MLQALEKAIKHPIRLLQPRYERLTDRLQIDFKESMLIVNRPEIPFSQK